MNVLIVDPDAGARLGLEECLQPLAQYLRQAGTGAQALEVVREVVEAGSYFDLLIMECNLPDMAGTALITTLREWDRAVCAQTGFASLRIVVATALNDRDTVLQCLKLGCSSFLVKPINRDSLGAALGRIGIEFPAPGQVSPAKEKAAVAEPAPAGGAQATTLQALLQSAGEISDIDFRYKLEKTLASGDTEMHEELVRTLDAPEVSFKIKLNILRVMGYVRTPRFLDALEKVIINGSSFFVMKEAVIAVSKYNDRKAFGILSAAVENITDETLLGQIQEAIARIRQDDPILALLPRFLGEYDKPSFRAVIDTFKRLLTPEDARIFLDYLHHDAPPLVLGALDILSHTADASGGTAIRQFTAEALERHLASGGEKPEDVMRILQCYRHFLERHPLPPEERLPELDRLYDATTDAQLKSLALTVLAMGTNPDTLARIRALFETDPAQRETILDGMADNPSAPAFLSRLFFEAGPLKGRIVQVLMKSAEGRSFLMENFFRMETTEQEVVARTYDVSLSADGVRFFRQVLDSDLVTAKSIILSKLGTVLEGDLRSLLEDKSREPMFLALGNAWMDTAQASFPVRLMVRLLVNIAEGTTQPGRVRDYLRMVAAAARKDVILPGLPDGTLARVAKAVVESGDVESGLAFLETLKTVNTFEPALLTDLSTGFKAYAEALPPNPSETLQGEVRQARDNIRRIQKELEAFTVFERELEALFTRQSVSPMQLEQSLTRQRLSVGVRIVNILQILRESVAKGGNPAFRARKIMQSYPKIDALFTQSESLADDRFLAECPAIGGQGSSLALHLSDRSMTALILDQFAELLPRLTVRIAPEQLSGEDALICDAAYLSRQADRQAPNVRNIYLIAEDREETTGLLSFNPKIFMQPVALSKLVRMVLSNLYL